MFDDITFDTETLDYYKEHYTSHESRYQGLHIDLIALWGLRLLEYQDAFKNMPGFPHNIHDESLILTTVGLVDDIEERYDIESFRELITSQLNTYKKYPVQIDPEMFSIFLEIKKDLGFSDDETKLFIFLLEFEENLGLHDICKCHGTLNQDESYKLLSYTLQIGENHLRKILSPIGEVEKFGFIKFNQENEITLRERCTLIDLIHLAMRRTISQKPEHKN